ncbi:hypothetical protein [Ramlibacter sp. PS4R-6]|uniref:hypothetical protein n=1 Tax=Ramlibacter sp. PS4R-6 TaxID=3133438 RepID=UPI00309D5A3F
MSEPSSTTSAAAEAARYALLRRLAPSMRHHLVVNLQPIGMVYEIMDRRLRAPEPNYAEVKEGAGKISGYARAALASCIDVVTWLAPDEAARCTAEQGIAECLSLIATGFTFRGFSLRDAGGAVAGEVRRASFRNVVTGAFLWLSDEHAPPAQIAIGAEAANDGLVISLSLTPVEGEPGFGNPPTYRPITWADVEALAAGDRVAVVRQGSGVRITLPWALASA